MRLLALWVGGHDAAKVVGGAGYYCRWVLALAAGACGVLLWSEQFGVFRSGQERRVVAAQSGGRCFIRPPRPQLFLAAVLV